MLGAGSCTHSYLIRPTPTRPTRCIHRMAMWRAQQAAVAAAAASIRTPTHASSSRRRAATATLSMQQLRRASSSSSSSSVALAAAPAAPVLQLPRQAAPSLASFTHGSTQRRGLATSPSSSSPDAGGGFASEREYHAAADEALEEVQALLEGMEDAVEDFEVNYSQGVLNVVMGEHGTWVMNKQTPNRQVWWSSPISGPLRFEYDPAEGKWRTTRGRRELFGLLAEEVRTATGVDILQQD